MARQSGGNVVIDSTPNEGTRVILSLPRATAVEESDTPAADDPLELPVRGMQNELVLVVDDDTAVRQVTVEMVRDLGCEVVQAPGGEQALALVDQLPRGPGLILLDYAMPAMNGLQLARALRERNITAPIALVTGYAELSEADIAAEQLGGLLRKPFTIRELRSLLTQLRTLRDTAEADVESGLVGR
jgi:CheY-like chemotaxis protein